MTTKIIPQGNRVLIKRVVDQEEKTRGGLFIPDTAKEKPQEAEIVSLSLSLNGRFLLGQHVIIGKYAGVEIIVDGIEHLVVHEDDILCSVEKVG